MIISKRLLAEDIALTVINIIILKFLANFMGLTFFGFVGQLFLCFLGMWPFWGSAILLLMFGYIAGQFNTQHKTEEVKE